MQQHNFVFNHLSLPASSAEQAYICLLDAVRGMLQIGDDGDRYALYADNASRLVEIELAKKYKYENFLEDLEARGEQDLHLVLLEVEDKTPMIDSVPESVVEAIAESAFYFPDVGYSGSIDILGLAWNIDATLLSLATDARWEAIEVEFAEHSETPSKGNSFLPNVSCRIHGVQLRLQRERLADGTAEDLFKSCVFSPEFLRWRASIHSSLKLKVDAKLQLAEEKKFAGGKPLFDTLNNADGMREIRFGNIDGGAVRILFKALGNNKQGVLMGFIKKSDNEGYTEAIKLATAELKKLPS